MISANLNDLLYIGLFSISGIIFVIVVYFISRLIRPARPSQEKLSIYECGMNPIGEPWVQFKIRYYIFALLFVIFDIETVFLFPWAIVYHKLGIYGLIEMFVFIVILFLGLVYAWVKGVLKWV